MTHLLYFTYTGAGGAGGGFVPGIGGSGGIGAGEHLGTSGSMWALLM